jgi:hypothetical protein
MPKSILIFLLVCSLFACDIGSVDMEKVNLEIENRIKTEKIKRTIKCTQSAREEAEIFVDSIITEITKNSLNNELSFPDRPSRDTISKHYEVKLDSVNIRNLLDSMIKTDQK